jgi:hypothetical protein
MIRSIFVSILFFFGPAILMFMLRNLFLFTRAWLRLRRQRQQQEHEVIDITPHKHASPSMMFNIAAIVVGLICAFLAWQEMRSGPEVPMHYVPAHVDEHGKIVPGKLVPLEEPATPDR